jgi:hypothetical protein
VQVPTKTRDTHVHDIFKFLAYKYLETPGSIGPAKFRMYREACFHIFSQQSEFSDTPDTQHALSCKFEALMKRMLGDAPTRGTADIMVEHLSAVAVSSYE